MKANGPELYNRVVVPGYGDVDCVIGKHASRDVYPLILAHLRSPAVQKSSTAATITDNPSSPAIFTS